MFVKKVKNLQWFWLKFFFYCQYHFDNTLVFWLFRLCQARIVRRIIEHYGADYHCNDQPSQNLDIASLNLGYGLIHQAIIRNIRPQRILCIGSMFGFIPFMLAQSCEQNNRGTVDFVDAGYSMNDPKDRKRHYFGQGIWKKINPGDHFNYFLKQERLRLYLMTSQQFFRKYRRRFDYIYIDGDHSYRGVKSDFKNSWPLLKKNGILAIHDIFTPDFVNGLPYGVNRFWKEIKMNRTYRTFEFPGKFGLGLVQKI